MVCKPSAHGKYTKGRNVAQLITAIASRQITAVAKPTSLGRGAVRLQRRSWPRRGSANVAEVGRGRHSARSTSC